MKCPHCAQELGVAKISVSVPNGTLISLQAKYPDYKLSHLVAKAMAFLLLEGER
jgi:hypothetical protein